jgi:hypothetical protein
MSRIIGLILLITRIYIVCKIGFLLFMTQLNPETYPISILTWWIYFLVFDIWLQIVLPPFDESPEE